MVGQWGYEVMENDIALDVKMRTEELIKGGFTLEESTDKILSHPENLKTDEIVLAIAKIEFDEYGHVKHMDETIKSLKNELRDEVLCTWGNSEHRRQALLDFALSVNIELQKNK